MRIRLACIATVVFTGNVFAQNLAQLVPADAVIYTSWRGTVDPGPGYAGSHWEALMKDSQAGRLIDETLPAIGSAVERKYPRDAGQWPAAVAAIRQMIRRPSAAFLTFDGSRPRGGFFCAAGTDAKELTQTLQQLVTAFPPMFSPRVVTPDGNVGLIFGYDADAAVEGDLDQQPDFKKGLAQCAAEPSYVLFVNVKSALALAGLMIERDAPPDVFERYQKFIDASGLSGVNAYTATAGFVDKDWQLDAFVDAPSPRKGLLAIDVTTPIDPTLLKRVPASANAVTLLRMDGNAVLKSVRDVAVEVDPRAGDMFDKIVGGATLAIGKNLQNDVLASLGTQWAVYTSPDVGGTEGTGVVVVNKLANPAKAKQALAAVAISASNWSKSMMPTKEVTVAGRMTKVGDLSVFYIATPVISPAYVIKDGYLYAGMFPQSVIAAAQFAGASIDAKPEFVKAITSVDGKQPLVVSYTDVKSTLANGYSLAMLGSRTLFGLSDIFLAATPEPILPPLSAMQAQAAPASGMMWADDAGLHTRTRSPFPGAETIAQLSVTNLYVTNVPMVASALLPSLNRARGTANRVKSASNLRQIGLACMMYANGSKDNAYPANVSELLHKEDLTVDVFINPNSGTEKPAVPAGQNAVDFFGQWAVEHGDYVYCGAGKTQKNESADAILAYEKPVAGEGGLNVLFMDGHVEWMQAGMVAKVFADAGLPSPMQ